MPNMSHTSRSSQFAPSHSGVTLGTAKSGSFRNVRTINRSFVSVFVNDVDQPKAIGRVAVIQIIDAGDIDQQIEPVRRSGTPAPSNSFSPARPRAFAAKFADDQRRKPVSVSG